MREKRTPGVAPPLVDFVERAAGSLSVGSVEELAAGDYRETEHFDGGDLSDYDLTGCSFLECRFTGVTLTDADLRGSRILETVFEAPVAHTLKAARTTWRDVRITSPRWGSAELFDSELDAVHLRGGKIDYLNLRGSRLSNVVVEDCSITDLDLGGATVGRVAFVGCRIGTLDTTGSTLQNVDLRGSSFTGLHGLAGLAGAVIDDGQLSLFAPLLAAHLGLRVE